MTGLIIVTGLVLAVFILVAMALDDREQEPFSPEGREAEKILTGVASDEPAHPVKRGPGRPRKVELEGKQT